MKTSFIQFVSQTIFVLFLLYVYSAFGEGELKNIDLSENSWQISDLTVSKTEPPSPDIKAPHIPQNWQPVEISRSWHEQFPHTYPEGKRNEMFWYQNNPIPHYVSGWYKTVFNTPQYGSDENVILKFDGAAYKALVFLNGNYVGSHKGSFTPFEFDVSGYLLPLGKNNQMSCLYGCIMILARRRHGMRMGRCSTTTVM